MEKKNEQLQELTNFIRDHRSNEQNFQLLYSKLEEELNPERANSRSEHYINSLAEIKQKQVTDYHQQKKVGGNTWSEFEKFVSEFEKVIIAEQKA